MWAEYLLLVSFHRWENRGTENQWLCKSQSTVAALYCKSLVSGNFRHFEDICKWQGVPLKRKYRCLLWWQTSDEYSKKNYHSWECCLLFSYDWLECMKIIAGPKKGRIWSLCFLFSLSVFAFLAFNSVCSKADSHP